MVCHPYLRFLARVTARQPRLQPPKDASLLLAAPSELPALMPYTHPISGYRGRSFERRRLELRVAELPRPRQQPALTNPTTISFPGDGHASRRISNQNIPNPLAKGNACFPQRQHIRHHDAHHRTLPQHAPDSTPSTMEPGAPFGSHPLLDVHSTGQAPKDAHAHSHLQLHTPPHAHSAAVTCPASRPPSYMEIYYPFIAQPWLWREYHPAGFPGLDPALILEDFDTFAADVAQRHVGAIPDSMLVTAFMERMTWHLHQQQPQEGHSHGGQQVEKHKELATHQGNEAASSHPLTWAGASTAAHSVQLVPTDMKLSGQVTWVGRSSMEVLLQLTAAAPSHPHAAVSSEGAQMSGPGTHTSCPGTPGTPATTSPLPAAPPEMTGTSEGGATVLGTPSALAAPQDPHCQRPPLRQLVPGQLIATAEFVMALRDLSLRRAVDVPPLHPEGPLERELFHRGREHQRQRQARRERERETVANHGTHTLAGGGNSLHSHHHTAATVAESHGQELLARALAEGLRGSELHRIVPTDTDAMRLLEPECGTGSEVPAVAVPASMVAADGPGAGQQQQPSKKRGWDDGCEGEGAAGVHAQLYDLQNHHQTHRQPYHHHHHFVHNHVYHGHHIHQAHHPQQGSTAEALSASSSPVPVRQTELHRTVAAQFQDRNTSGTVFGGHLLRLAYEHAAATAAAFAGGPCELLWLEECAISSPARVGDMLHAVARVVWAEPGGRALRVVVRLGKYDVASPAHHTLALTLAAAFMAPEPVSAVARGVPAAAMAQGDLVGGTAGVWGMEGRVVGGGLREVVPVTLMEAGEAVAAQRRHATVLAALEEVERMGPEQEL